MKSYSLLVSIVPRNHGSKLTEATKKAGLSGATLLLGRGTAKTNLLQVLGFGDTEKDLIYMVVESTEKEKILNTIYLESQKYKKPYGILFSISVNNIFKSNLHNESNANSTEEANMSNKKFELITAIINAGYADDVMAAARKAGAGGGTVINARGTGTEQDASFFGITIVPEKEVLIILVDKQKVKPVIEAIESLSCLAKPGSGIVFSNDVDDFKLLGKDK